MKLPAPFVLSLTLFSTAALILLQRLNIADPDLQLTAAARDAAGAGNPESGEPSTDSEIREWSPEAIRALPPDRLRALARKMLTSSSPDHTAELLGLFSRWAELEPRDGLRWLIRGTSAEDFQKTTGPNSVLAAAAFLSTALRLDPGAFPELLGESSWTESEKIHLIRLRQLAVEISSPVPPELTAPIPLSQADSERVRGMVSHLEKGLRPEETLRRQLAGPNTEKSRRSISETLRGLQRKDPDKTLELAVSVPPELDHEGQVLAVMKQILEKRNNADPASTLEFVVHHPGKARASGFLEAIRPQLAAAGPEAILTAAAQIPEADARQQLIAQAAVGLAQTDPPAAARLMLNDGMEFDESLLPLWTEVAAAFARQPDAAREQWLHSLPPGSTRDAAVSSIARQWVKSGEVDKGLAFLGQVQDQLTRDRSRASLALEWMATDPNQAMVWLRGPDTGLREDIREAILKSWPGALYTGPRP